MKFLLLLLLVALFYTTPAVVAQLPEQWLELPVDHFNLFDNRTWKMRYFVNDEFFEDGQPLFVDVGGEWEVDGSTIQSGQMHLLGKKHRGMLVATEHRYYGKSLPFGTDFSEESLKYLQIEQGLEDLAYFIEHYKSTVPGLKDSKVIIHGCSYPGMLVTWMRLRFPHIVDIAYASSAPLGVGLEYPEYFEVVHDVYANVSDACIQTIKRGFNITQELAKSILGLKTIRNALRDWTCGDVDNMNSVEMMAKMVTVINVMHDPLQFEQLSCQVMAKDDVSSFHQLATFIAAKSQVIPNCGDEPDPTGDAARSARAWGYQTCTEMGTFQTLSLSDSRNPFAVDRSLQESVDECVKEFGGKVTQKVLETGIERVMRRYGGKRPKVTKVLTVQGTHDPWKHLALLEDYNPEAPVMVIEGSHCIDVSEGPEDPQQLIDVRKKIRDTLSKWIDEIS